MWGSFDYKHFVSTGGAPCDHPQNLGDKLVKNSTGKRSAVAFKLKPTMAFAGQAAAGAEAAKPGAGTACAKTVPVAARTQKAPTVA